MLLGDNRSRTLERSTRIALATGFALTVSAMLFILIGDGIEYFSNLIGSSPGHGLGASFVWTGYGIIALLVIVFISVIAYLAYRAMHDRGANWSID